MREETLAFSKEKYFNGYHNKRSIEKNWSMIKSFLEQTTTANIPSKKASRKVSLPWVTKGIKALIRKRDRTHAMFKKTKNPRVEQKWKEERRQVRKEVEKAHSEHINNLIGDVSKDAKPFWKYINNQKADKQGIPPLVRKDNTQAESDLERAEALNAQFTSVFTETKYESVPIKMPQQKMPDLHIEKQGVTKILKSLNTSKAMGPDAIHPRILKELAYELTDIVTHLFQQSIDTGQVPSDWNQANICPLFKKNDRTIPSNYRPVSLTCILCKMLEHIICSNVMDHLENNTLLNERQHAFRKQHSCETQPVNIINESATSIDKCKQTKIFILDFEK